MKRQCISMIVALPAALLLACAANAQQTMPQTTPPQTRPATSTTTQNMQNMRRNSTRTAPSFATLAGSKGYVTKTDTQGHQWWANHFSKCDADHNGKLTRTEYAACRSPQ
ncbi:MAG TPA: hypothetical protein VFW60_02130 [Rhodanobacteraceae bacterium]|nr:hypothetical protein [Rhodanobacteraceae bacterium]